VLEVVPGDRAFQAQQGGDTVGLWDSVDEVGHVPERGIGRLAVSLALLFATAFADAAAVDSRPNIILIMCDDAGFGDFGFTGGIAETPVLDRMADEGVLFTRAYNNARCMPTRATLMTGLNSCISYERRFVIRGDTVTIPEILREGGYATYMIGKWHIGQGGKSEWDTNEPTHPTARGFDRFYGIWAGAAGVHKPQLLEYVARKEANDGKGFAPSIIEDGRELPWDEVPDDYYNTTTWTDKAVDYIESTPDDQPFFLYAAYTAPHWPLDPPESSMERYQGRFDSGWDALRAEVHERQKKLGIIPSDHPLPPPEPGTTPWDPNSQEAGRFIRDCMKYYASITEMDTAIGRLLETVEATGRADNTLVFFLSDNGADWVIGKIERGHLSNTPFSGYKVTYFEGGACTPLIAYWPGATAKGVLQHEQQVIVEDFMATILDITGLDYPETRAGWVIPPMEGRSFLQAMRDPDHGDPDRTHCWAHAGARGVIHEGWKAVYQDKRASGKHVAQNDGWYLYRHEPHRAELEELRDEHPEKLAELIAIWRDWAESVGWAPHPTLGNKLHPSDAANADELPVEEAMSQDVFSVAPEDSLNDVAKRMAEEKIGSAVVLKENRVVGVFTTIDALRALI